MMRAMDPFLPDDSKLDAIRELLPSVGSGIRLDITVAGPFPAETDRAVRQSDEHQLRVGRGGPDRVEDLEQRTEEARSVVAAVLSASPDQVVLTPGPAAALIATLVAGGPAANVRIELFAIGPAGERGPVDRRDQGQRPRAGGHASEPAARGG